MNNHLTTLDVREEIRQGREPFSKIMGAVDSLGPDDNFLLIAPFEPVPLFNLLAKQGFQHASQKIATAHWEVLFTRNSEAESSQPKPDKISTTPKSSVVQIVEVDARRLEPPQPLVKILEALATLPDGAELRARTDRRPIHLYSHLAERGFTGESEEQTDGSFITHIRHL